MASLFQFSIRSLLVGVAITAVGIGALLNANAWWQASVWCASLFMLASAVALVLYRRDGARAFWIGFGIFGWMYLYLLVQSWTAHANDRWDPLSQRSLITTKLTRLAYEKLLPDSITARAIAGPQPWAAPATPNPSYVSREDFTNIAHALWLLAVGALGGKVCQLIYRTKPAAE